MNRKRALTLFLILLSVVILATASWIAGSKIQSPAEAAARTAPPTPSPILVPVEERVLTTDVVTRGTARFGSPQTISLAPSSLKSSAGVITTLPDPDTQLQEGDVLLTSSGRPVFILQGEIPAYRDLVPGISGADVRQLENGLVRLGFDPGPVDGLYDEQTSAAVSAWYESTEIQPFGSTADEQTEIRTLEQALANALNSKSAADDAVASAPLALKAARANAEAVDKAAAIELAAAISETELEMAQAAVLASQLAGEVTIQAAIDAQKVAEREAKIAADLVDKIGDDLDQARHAANVKIPIDEIIFNPYLPVRVEELEAAIGDVASGPLFTFTNNQLSIDSSLPLDEAPLVRPGMAVVIDEPDLGIEASGVVEYVAEAPGTDGADGFHIYFETLVKESSTSLEGFSLRLKIVVESTGGPVIAVPISALSLAADGSSRVQVDNNGALEFVTVEPGLSADGFVEVTPIDGTLVPGQLVVIGFENH